MDSGTGGGTSKPWGGRFEAEQAPLFERFRASVKRLGTSEYYHLAASTVGPPNGIERDLFERL